MSKGSALMTSIERATSENLLRSDPYFNSSVKDLINSRPDMPKEAIQILKKRIVARNPKIQILTFELLDFLVQALPLPFHTQVSSRDFIAILSQIYKSKDVDFDVKNRLNALLVLWYSRFADHKDILPGFTDIYIQLKLGSELRTPDARPSSLSQTFTSSPSKTEASKKLADSKIEKLKQDLQVVRNNASLTNDMIQARESPNSETLVELASTLRAMEGKVLKLIERLEDSEMLEYCLNVKDELQDVIRKYDDYKSGKIFSIAEKWGLVAEPDVHAKHLAEDLLLDSPINPQFPLKQESPTDLIPGPASASYMFNPSLQPNPVNSQSGFDSLFGSSLTSGQGLAGSAFATNQSVSGSSGQFISQQVGVSPFVSKGSGGQDELGFSGNEILGLNLNPFNTAGPVIGAPLENLAKDNLHNFPSEYSNEFGQVTDLNPLAAAVNLQNIGNIEGQTKVNVNYKPSENFDDPFLSSLGTGTEEENSKAKSSAVKDKNFDELFDFKF